MITLSREAVAVLDEPDSMQVWPLRITAVSDTEGVPDAIFVYHRNTMTDETGDSDIFECVASGPQLQELGLGDLGLEELPLQGLQIDGQVEFHSTPHRPTTV